MALAFALTDVVFSLQYNLATWTLNKLICQYRELLSLPTHAHMIPPEGVWSDVVLAQLTPPIADIKI